MDLRNSVVIPREDFLELQEVAFDNQNPLSLGDRAINSAQAILICGGIGTVVVLTMWGLTNLTDRLEERRHRREVALLTHRQTIKNNPLPNSFDAGIKSVSVTEQAAASAE